MKLNLDLLIPVYNGRRYFDTLLSDLDKVRHHFNRVIFYDDASRDGSAEYLKKKGCEVLYGPENRGQAFARNALLAATTAEFVHFHDMDDPLVPSFFENILPELKPTHISVGRFVADYERQSIEYHLPPSLQQQHLSLEAAYRYFIHLNSVIFPRVVLQTIGGFRPELRIHEDRFLFLCLAHSHFPWQVCESAVARQWCHANNTCSTVGEKFYRINWIRYFELAFELISPADLKFLHHDILQISHELLRDGEFEMARRGFRLCDKIGVDNFSVLTPKSRWFCRRIGFFNAYRLKRLLGRRLKLV